MARPPLPLAGADQGVTLQNVAFNPAQVTVTVGETVTWTHNDGSTPHTVTSSTASEPFESSSTCTDLGVGNCMTQGDTFPHTFNNAGTVAYHCRIHSGMTGTVVVVEPEPSTTTSSSTTTTQPPTTTRQATTSSRAAVSSTSTSFPDLTTSSRVAIGAEDDGEDEDETAADGGGDGGSGGVTLIVLLLVLTVAGGSALLWWLHPSQAARRARSRSTPST